mgnify:CR=1 FL=1
MVVTDFCLIEHCLTLTRNNIPVVFTLCCVHLKHLRLREPLQERHYARHVGGVIDELILLLSIKAHV